MKTIVSACAILSTLSSNANTTRVGDTYVIHGLESSVVEFLDWTDEANITLSKYQLKTLHNSEEIVKVNVKCQAEVEGKILANLISMYPTLNISKVKVDEFSDAEYRHNKFDQRMRQQGYPGLYSHSTSYVHHNRKKLEVDIYRKVPAYQFFEKEEKLTSFIYPTGDFVDARGYNLVPALIYKAPERIEDQTGDLVRKDYNSAYQTEHLLAFDNIILRQPLPVIGSNFEIQINIPFDQWSECISQNTKNLER